MSANRQGMGRQRLKAGMEYDAVYARRDYTYLANQPGLVAFVKRAIHKRERKAAKSAIRRGEE